MKYVIQWRSWLACGLLAACVLACGADTRFVMIGTARAPSTSGVIEVDDIDGGNTLVTVHLEHLHPPNRMGDGYSDYVVWVEPEGGASLWIGTLDYAPEARTGDFTGTSPASTFVVKITAEQEPHPPAPGDFIIASRNVKLD